MDSAASVWTGNFVQIELVAGCLVECLVLLV